MRAAGPQDSLVPLGTFFALGPSDLTGLKHEPLNRDKLAMEYQWKSTSRYGTSRHFVFDGKDQVTVTCSDVLYTTYTQDESGKLNAVDPDGGPYLSVNGVMGSMTHTFRVLDILYHKDSKRSLVVGLRVEKIT